MMAKMLLFLATLKKARKRRLNSKYRSPFEAIIRTILNHKFYMLEVLLTCLEFLNFNVIEDKYNLFWQLRNFLGKTYNL